MEGRLGLGSSEELLIKGLGSRLAVGTLVGTLTRAPTGVLGFLTRDNWVLRACVEGQGGVCPGQMGAVSGSHAVTSVIFHWSEYQGQPISTRQGLNPLLGQECQEICRRVLKPPHRHRTR